VIFGYVTCSSLKVLPNTVPGKQRLCWDELKPKAGGFFLQVAHLLLAVAGFIIDNQGVLLWHGIAPNKRLQADRLWRLLPWRRA
jgi:hypothetical protein